MTKQETENLFRLSALRCSDAEIVRFGEYIENLSSAMRGLENDGDGFFYPEEDTVFSLLPKPDPLSLQSGTELINDRNGFSVSLIISEEKK